MYTLAHEATLARVLTRRGRKIRPSPLQQSSIGRVLHDTKKARAEKARLISTAEEKENFGSRYTAVSVNLTYYETTKLAWTRFPAVICKRCSVLLYEVFIYGVNRNRIRKQSG